MPTEVYISNISEDVWDFIQSMSTDARAQEIQENAELSDREVWALPHGGRAIAILPAAVDPDFLAYYHQVSDTSQVEVWTPAAHTGETCRDILADDALMSKLIALSQDQPLTLTSYSASRQFFTLVHSLREQGGQILTPEAPATADSWTVNFFGSKSGIRQVTDQLATPVQPWMAPGQIMHGLPDVVATAVNVYHRTHGVVLKTYKAHAGAGVLIFRPGDLPPEFDACVKKLMTILEKETYWSKFPVIVEALLDVDASVGGGNPNCEYLIKPDGRLQLLYYCGMRVSAEGVFKGIEIHHRLLPKKTTKLLDTYGKKLGTTYAQAGYRGYFDVDCIATTDQQVLITESNVRRTGGTHVYHTAHRLLGDDFMKERYILSHNTYRLPSEKTIRFAKLQTLLKPLLFSPKTREGLVIASANSLQQHTFGYIIFGRDQAAALAIEARMEQLLEAALGG